MHDGRAEATSRVDSRAKSDGDDMAKLIYTAIGSLDGYVEDASGSFEWAAPDEEVHAFANELERPIRTFLYGRRMYETMVFWETVDPAGDWPAVAREFAASWQAADKVVYSRTLETVSSARTRLERELDAGAIEQMKQRSDTDIGVGGAELGGQAIVAGLVDELQLLFVPVLVGGGKRALPDGVDARLELLEERRFQSGVVFLRYAVRH
jgi:dihydrofolate reductase